MQLFKIDLANVLIVCKLFKMVVAIVSIVLEIVEKLLKIVVAIVSIVIEFVENCSKLL